MDYLETSFPIFVSIAVILGFGYLLQSKSSLVKKFNELKQNYENKSQEDEKKIANQSSSIIKINKDLDSLTQNINAIKGQNSNEKMANQIEKQNTKNENIFATKVELSELQQQIIPLQHQLKDVSKNIESKKQQIAGLVKQSDDITKKQKEFGQQIELLGQQQTLQTQSIQESLEKQIKQIVTEQIKNMKKEHQLLQNMINEQKQQTQNELKSVNERIDNQIQLNQQQQQQTEDPNLQINQEITNIKQELSQIQWQSFQTNIEFELQSLRQLQQDFNTKIQEQQNDTIQLKSSINENANDQINQLVACLRTQVEDLSKQFDEYKGKQQDQFSLISQQLEVQEAKQTETNHSQTILQEKIEARQNQLLENNLNIEEIKQRLHELSLSNPQLIENIDMLKQSQLQLTNQSNENLEKNLQYQKKLEQDIISLKQSLLDHQNQIQQQDTEEDQSNIQLQALMQQFDDLKLQIYQMDDGLKQNLNQKEETDLKLASLTDAIKQINPDSVAEIQKEINLIKSDLLKQSNETNINQQFETLQVQFKELNQKIEDAQHKVQASPEVQSESNDNLAVKKEIDQIKGLLIQFESQFNAKIEQQELEKFVNQIQQQIADQISTFQNEHQQLKLQISVQNENLSQSNRTHTQEMEQKIREEILLNQQTQIEISNKLTTKIEKEIELLNNQFQSFQQQTSDIIKEFQTHQEKQIEQINIQKLAQQGDHTSEIADIKNYIHLISQTQNSIQGQLQNKQEQEEVKKLNDQIQQIQSQIKELIKLDHVQEFAEISKELQLVKNTQFGIQSQMKESIEKQDLEAQQDQIKKQMSDQIQNSQKWEKEKDSEISKLFQDLQQLNTTLSSSIGQIQEQIVKIQEDQLSMITQLKSKVEQQEHNNQLEQISQQLTDSNQENQSVLNEQKDQLCVQKEKLLQYSSTHLSEIQAVKEILHLIKQTQLEMISQLSTKIGQQEITKINSSLEQIQLQIKDNQTEVNQLKVETEKLKHLRQLSPQQSQSPQEIKYILDEIPKITKTQQSIFTQLSTKIGLQDFETKINKLQGKILDSEQAHQTQFEQLNEQIISHQQSNLKSLQDLQKQSENLLQLSKEDILSKLSISKSQLSEDFQILTTNMKEVLQLFNQKQQQQSDLQEIIKLLLNNNPQQTQAPNKDTNATSYKIYESLKRINDFIQQFQYQPQFESNEVRLKNITEIIEQIYENSWKKRHIEYKFKFFVREIESEQEMQRNYSIRKSESKAKLKKVCTSFRQARGDGNCFYTAFGYQFLQILLTEYSDQQFGDFIQEMKKICLPMKLNAEQIQISEYDSEQQLLEEFLYRLEKLRQIPDSEREEKFTQQFAAFEQVDETDGVFYGLSTIFFRNLANYVVEFSEMKEALFDRENLLIWEKECNSNEIVIEALAKYLKIRIQLVFFDQGGLEVKEYFQDRPNRVILLIKPGHYSIGIKDQNSQLTIESYTKKISAEILGLLNTPLKEEEVQTQQRDEQPNQNNQIVQLFEKSLIQNQEIINSQAQIIEQFQKNLEICIQKHENLGNEIQKLNSLIFTQGERIIKFETHISSIEQILEYIQKNLESVKHQCQSKFAELKSQLQDQYQQFTQQINEYQIIQQQIDNSNINAQSQAINQQQIQQTEQVQIHQQIVDLQQGDNISQNEQDKQISVSQVDQQQTSDNVQHQEQNENQEQGQIQERDQHQHPQDNQNQQNSEEQQQPQEEQDIY